ERTRASLRAARRKSRNRSRRRLPTLRDRSSRARIAAVTAWRKGGRRLGLPRGNAVNGRNALASAPDRGGDGDEREPPRRGRAPVEAAPQRGSVRRGGDPHAGRAGGKDRPLEGRRESVAACRGAGAGMDRGKGQS